ncbi:restriction endonuclease [Streptomyces canarius]
MAEVDALSWQEFEAYVADLCRRDGCTRVVVSGKSGRSGRGCRRLPRPTAASPASSSKQM